MRIDIADEVTSQRLFGQLVPRALWVQRYMEYFRGFCDDIDEPVTLATAHEHAVEMVGEAYSAVVEELMNGGPAR